MSDQKPVIEIAKSEPTEINKKPNNKIWRFVIRNKTWILGVFIILAAFNYFQYSFFGAIFALAAGILTLPPVYLKVKDYYQKKHNFKFTRLISSIAVFILFFVGFTITGVSSEPIRKAREEKLAKEKAEKIEKENLSKSEEIVKQESEKKQSEEAKAKSEASKKAEDEKKRLEEELKKIEEKKKLQEEEQKRKDELLIKNEKIEYNTALKQSANRMSENLTNFSILKIKPLPSMMSKDEIIKLSVSSVIIENEHDAFIKNIPSEKFLTTHELYIEALRNYKLAMPVFRNGIDKSDSLLLQESNQYIKIGNEYIQKALAEAGKISN